MTEIVSVNRLCSECIEEGKETPMFNKNGEVHIHNIRKSEAYKLSKQETLKQVQDISISPEEFMENKGLIELQYKFLEDINNKGIDYGLVSLRALIRIYISKYQQELKKQMEKI